jgi:hypothetical protein
MKFIPCSFLLLVLATGCKKDKPNSNGGYNTFISQASYYYSTDPSVSGTNVSIDYGANQRIDAITQTFPSSTGADSWTFTYNANGSIAGVKGSGADWFAKQNYLFYYNTMGRLDSILVSDKAYDGDTIRYMNAYQYDTKDHIKSSYTYTLTGSTTLNFAVGDTFTKVVFFRGADLDSVRYISYNYAQLNVPPSAVTNHVHFNKIAASDLKSLDPALLFWFAIRSNPYAPGNVIDPFWYQFINPDLSMVRGGDFSDSFGDHRTYNFNAQKDADGNFTMLSYRSSGQEHKDSINLSYTKIPK